MPDSLIYGPILYVLLNAITPSMMEDFPLVGITSTDEEPLFNKQDRIYMITKYIQGDTVTFPQ